MSFPNIFNEEKLKEEFKDLKVFCGGIEIPL